MLFVPFTGAIVPHSSPPPSSRHADDRFMYAHVRTAKPSLAALKYAFPSVTCPHLSLPNMAQLPCALHVAVELLLAFIPSALIVLGLLSLAAVPFPFLLALQITFFCTLVVLAALRTAGVLLSAADPSPEPEFLAPQESDKEPLGSKLLCAVPANGGEADNLISG
ncbi:hypothetical protein C8R44DRAFT_885873 [Mycena epipterygia]|nr:hypothetical protein C8R44DRAFT_885873 [Mycena epipterygia]